MTSSEPKPAPRLLLAGHLHPGMLILRTLDGLRGAILPVAIGLLTGQMWLLVASGTFFVFALAFAVARYVTFEYRLTDEELVTREGILHRQERRIPVDRIQDLSFESTLIRRFLGLVVVSVETASSQGAEAKLDSLQRRDAGALREALFQSRSARGLRDPVTPPSERLLWHAGAGDLFLLGLTNNRIGVILAALFGVYELVDELGLTQRVGGALTGWMASLPPGLAIAIACAAAFLALLGGWVASVAASFLVFHDFRLTVRDEVFQRRYGLITTRAASLPLRRIQKVLLEQSWLRRLLGVGVLRADSAGSGAEPREDVRGGRDIVVPLAPRWRAEALLPLLLPGLDLGHLSWRRVSPRVILRIFLKGALSAAVLLPLGWISLKWTALLVLLLLPISYAVGVLSYHNLGYAELEGHFGLRWGIIGSYRAVLPLRKVQGVVVRATPLDRCLGLANLTVYVAGGSPTTLRHLPRGEADLLQLRLARRAAASRFIW